jgi:hypothetical protein
MAIHPKTSNLPLSTTIGLERNLLLANSMNNLRHPTILIDFIIFEIGA